MCGIVGFTDRKDRSILEKMLIKVHHRGVDDSACFEDGYVSLGIKRLAINDLRKNLYPLWSADRQLVLIFNGEIYNYKGLIQRFRRFKYKLKTKVDGEIILLLYEKFGKDCLELLDGMFAFVLYDKRKKVLFCARDRFGKKPFYYSVRNKKFIFGSEAKSLLVYPNISKKIDYQALYYYLRFGFIPLNLSIFEDVKKLSPGHVLIWDLKTKKIKIQKYWDINFIKKISVKNKEEIERQLENKLLTSVEQRLISDVPFGVYLSGGVDSGLIAAMIKKIIKKPFPTFSVRIPGKDYDESQKAQQLSKFIGTNHQVINFKADDVINNLDKLSRFSDEPISDPAALPTLKMSKEAKKKVKVVITGEGADELFAGYNRYIKELQLFEKWKFMPKIISKNYKYPFPYNILQILSKPQVYYYPQHYFTLRKAKKIISHDMHNKIDFYRDPFLSFKSKKFKNNLDLMLYTDVKSRLVDQLLIKGDRMTMANQIEARAPYLSRLVSEYAASLATDLKINGFYQNKYILRRLTEKYLPKKFCWQKKHSFRLPLDKWLRNDFFSLAEESFSLLANQSLPIDISYAKRILNDHRLGKNNGLKIWCLTCLINWYKNL